MWFLVEMCHHDKWLNLWFCLFVILPKKLISWDVSVTTALRSNVRWNIGCGLFCSRYNLSSVQFVIFAIESVNYIDQTLTDMVAHWYPGWILLGWRDMQWSWTSKVVSELRLSSVCTNESKSRKLNTALNWMPPSVLGPMVLMQ